jgi:Protein of unknown function (DUF2630)
MVDDADVIAHISELVNEEHALERDLEGRSPGDDDKARLRALEVALDQCWDLLRQRRARRQYGGDPSEAEVRPADVVEKYRQ